MATESWVHYHGERLQEQRLAEASRHRVAPQLARQPAGPRVGLGAGLRAVASRLAARLSGRGALAPI